MREDHYSLGSPHIFRALALDFTTRMPAGIEEQLEGGWVRVGRGQRYPPKCHKGFGAEPQMKGLTLERLREDFTVKAKQWHGSSCRQATLAILDRQQPDGGWRIEKAMCLATSSFSRDNWQSRQRSMTQWAVFDDLVQHLQTKQQHPIVILAQEPNYTPLDHRFLDSLGVQILDSDDNAEYPRGIGEAKQHLGPGTFIFEPFMDLGSDGIADMCAGDPALYIGNPIENWVEKYWRGKDRSWGAGSAAPSPSDPAYEGWMEDGCPIALFVEARRGYRFPRFEEDPNVLEGLRIYWKEAGEEPNAGG